MEKQVEKSGVSGTTWTVIIGIALIALITMAFYFDVGLKAF